MWINKLDKHKSILALAPMADMTDSPFCQIVRQIGGVDIIFREMVSSEAIVRDNEKTWKMVEFVESERPIVQQIFGADPKTMAKAASLIMERAKPDGIDINMGCPVRKITSNFNGCALMKDPDLAGNIIKEVKKAIGDIQLSVKIRLGWSDPDEFKKFIPVIEKAGADMITIHGRTKSQGYSGKSDWKRIAEAKKIVNIPILANGDIHQPEQVSEALEITGADGVSIARGALGNPWFFHQVKEGNKEGVSLEERKNIVLQHAKLHIEHYGEGGITTFRKHLAWYFKTNKIGFNIPSIREWRSKLVRVKSLQELEEILNSLSSK
jgi:tRNA-dihydrouridine synthase B